MFKKFDINFDSSGNGLLGYFEFDDLPFTPQRAYWLSKVAIHSSRGMHAHKNLSQLFINLSGSFDLTLDDGSERLVLGMKNSGEAILLKPGLWRELRNFSKNSLVFVLCDQKFSEDDYIRDYSNFLKWKNSNQ
jgi:hypothetical protein